MFFDKVFRVTFLISLLTHGVIFFHSPNLNPFSPAPKKQEIEVRYIKEKLQVKSLNKASSKTALQSQPPKSDPFLKLDNQIIAGSRVPPPYIEQSSAYKGQEVSLIKSLVIPKPTFASPDLIAIKRKITLPPIEMAKIDNPSYITYYQIVREKIRRSAYQNYTHNETGDVYISFIISNDGFIKDVRMIEGKTTASDYLRSVALRSVRDASPFPNFPKELDYPQLSFNIIISFAIE
ncbi:MAG: energy transducer TonB [Candidatus Omnitrophota bacterium]|nr:energy transducer TonB [Candidatus Omnitrophota bacterium]